MSNFKYFALPALALGLATVSATAADQSAIPGAGHKGIIGWQGDGTEGVWLKAADDRWYYAQTESGCGALASAREIGFRISARGELDRDGALLVGGMTCPLSSLVRSDGPNG
jgi:hypothetical protein